MQVDIPFTQDALIREAQLHQSVHAVARAFNMSHMTLRKYAKAIGVWPLPLRPRVYATGGTAWNSGKTKADDPRLARLSEQRRGAGNPMHGKRPWNAGRSKENDERLLKISQALIGRTPSDETRRSMSSSAKNRTRHGMTGKRHSEATRSRLRDAAIAQIQSGRVSHTATRPHVAVREALKALGAQFEEEVRVGLFVVDFLVGDDVVIEVHGDFWHANPKSYPNGPVKNVQRLNCYRDQVKARVIRERGLRFIIIWESDVNDGTFTSILKREL